MNIEILTYLEQTPKANPNNPNEPDENEPLTETEIEVLETLYNNGNPFPKALRELLFWLETIVMCLTMALLTPKRNFKKIKESLSLKQVSQSPGHSLL